MGLAKSWFVLAFLLAGVNRKIAQAWEARKDARQDWQRRMAAYEAELRGESAAKPSPAALRERRTRAAQRAPGTTTLPTTPNGRPRPAARVTATRQENPTPRN